MWGCFLMSGVKILHFLKDWWKSIPIHQNYTMALSFTAFMRSSCVFNLVTFLMQDFKYASFENLNYVCMYQQSCFCTSCFMLPVVSAVLSYIACIVCLYLCSDWSTQPLQTISVANNKMRLETQQLINALGSNTTLLSVDLRYLIII